MTFQDSGRLWRIADVKGGQVCLDRTGIILVEVVAGRFAAGESLDDLARDYHVLRGDVEAALRLVVASVFTTRGLPVAIERKMEQRIPLLPARR